MSDDLNENSRQEPEYIFTEKQETILQLFAQGMRTKEVAHELKITEAGVNKHIEAITKKLNVARMSDATYAYQRLVYEDRDRGIVTTKTITMGRTKMEITDFSKQSLPRRLRSS